MVKILLLDSIVKNADIDFYHARLLSSNTYNIVLLIFCRYSLTSYEVPVAKLRHAVSWHGCFTIG
jgi:hypothetical protein